MSLFFRPISLSLALLLAVVMLPLRGEAFANVKVGEVIENAELPVLGGGKHSLLGKDKVNVFVFFKPGQEHSHTTLVELARCANELAGKSVHWVAVVSDRYPTEEVQAEVKQTGFTAPVLIDAGDALYGKLGVALHPVVGIADAKHALVAYQPFTKINYCDTVKARIRFGLGEISQAELEQVLNPPEASQGGEAAVARRFYKMGERLLKAGDLTKALDSAKKSIERDASQAPSHSLLGAILAAQGNCAEANKAFDQALAIDKADARAVDGKKGCAGK